MYKYAWFLVLAMMGQTTQPAAQEVRTKQTPVIRVAQANRQAQNDRARPARRRAERQRSATTRPSRPRITVSDFSSNIQEHRPTTRPAATQPARRDFGPQDLVEAMAEIGEFSGAPLDIEVTANGDLIIYGNESDLEILQKLVALMDREVTPLQFQIFQLQNAQAAKLASQVEKFWNAAKKPPSGNLRPEDRISIIPDSRSNSLMVAAAASNMEEIGDIIKQLDQSTFAEEIEFVPLKVEHIPVEQAAEKLQTMLTKLQERRGESATLIDIVPDPRLNTLMVSGAKQDIEQLKQWLNMIDVPPTEATGGVVQLRFFFLKKAEAKGLASLLEEMLDSESEASEAVKEQVRRLKLVHGEDAIENLDLEKPIKLYADDQSNALLVATVEENMAPLGEIINLLDTLPVAEEMAVRFFALDHADAEELLNTLTDMFSAGQRLPGLPGRESDVPDRISQGFPGAALAHNIALSADRRTNTLLAAGQMDQILLVQQVVDAVDQPSFAGKFSPRMIHLEHADARRLEEIAQQLADQWAEAAEKAGPIAADKERVLIIGDLRSNSLIVAANDQNFQEIQKLAEMLDKAPEDFLGDIHIITLENLTAADLADKIEALWERRSQQRAEEDLPEDMPVLVSDARSNSLIIASNKEDFEAIQQLVQRLEQQKLSPMADIRLIELKHNSASTVGDLVQDLFDQRMEMSLSKGQEEQPSDRVAVASEPLTNTLIIASNKSHFEEIQALVGKLDAMPSVDGAVRVFQLQHADVSHAAEMIEDMFDQEIYRGTAGDQELPEAETRIAVVPDVRSQSLLISASPQNFAIVEMLIKQIDREDVPEFEDTRFYTLENADVVSVANILEQLFEGMADAQSESEMKEQYNISVIPDSRSNTLIVAGSRFAMKKADSLIPKLDREPGAPTSDTRVYFLEQASAGKLEEILTELFENRESQGQDERTPVVVLGDEGSNSLIVSASAEDHAVVQDLVTKLDQKSTLSQRMEIIKLQDAKADQVAETLQNLIEQQELGSDAGKINFAIEPEPRTNSLLVWAPPGLMSEIRQIVETLDNTRSKVTMGLQVVRLMNARAEDLSELLNDFFEEAQQGNKDEARQMIIKFIKGYDEQTHAPMFDELVYQDVTISPDPNTNSLIIMAPQSNIDMVRMMVEMLDSVKPVVAEIRQFQLYNANATEMKDLLDELFQTGSSGGGGGGARGEEGRQLVFGPGGAEALASGGGTAIELTFSVDPRTNTLIAAGSEAYLNIVEELVQKLDEKEPDDRIIEVRRLQHAKADEVATAMEDFFDAESQLYEEGGEGEEAASRKREREVSITSVDEEEGASTLLLLSYSPRMRTHIESMIAELDQPPPQVMIQVLMAEVTLNDNFEMGMEFALQDLIFSEHAYVGPNGVIKGSEFDVIGGTDVGAAGSGGVGGFSFSVTGEDFSFLLRALQTEGRLEILSRPSILVRDGQEATIQVGERVPVVTQLNVSTNGAVTPSVDYEEVGVGLDVTPIINPDGYVNLDIKPQIDALTDSGVTVATGVTLPTFTNREVETSVTVRDGETIIVGGLITTRDNDSETKVPLFGDIPVLGNAFRSTSKRKTKTELLIVLTPKVIRTPSDARKVSVEMRDQTGMMDRTRTSPLLQGLRVKPGEDQFGPDQSQIPGDRTAPMDDQPATKEEYGPMIEGEEMGPDVSLIHIEPDPIDVQEIGPQIHTVSYQREENLDDD